MPVGDFFDLYTKAQEKEIEKYAWELWLVQYPQMTKETFVTFNDFLSSIKTGETEEQGIYIDQIGL